MKKGKTSPILGFKNAKVLFGTVDSINFKSLYINIQTWVQPIVDVESWNRVVLNLSRQIKHTVLEVLNKSIFQDKFIVDLDLRSSGLTLGKKSFLNLEINLFLNNNSQLDFKDKIIKDSVKKISKFVISENFTRNPHFKFHLRKTAKEKVVLN